MSRLAHRWSNALTNGQRLAWAGIAPWPGTGQTAYLQENLLRETHGIPLMEDPPPIWITAAPPVPVLYWPRQNGLCVHAEGDLPAANEWFAVSLSYGYSPAVRYPRTWNRQHWLLTGPMSSSRILNIDEPHQDNAAARITVRRFSAVALASLPYTETLMWHHPPIWRHSGQTHINNQIIGTPPNDWQTRVTIANGVVAIVDSDGTLRIAGELSELPYTSETVQAAADSPNGEIEWDEVSGAICFALPNATTGEYVRVAALDGSGNLRVAGLAEYSYPLARSLSALYGLAYYMWSAPHAALDVSPSRNRTFLRFHRTSIAGITNAILDVKGLAENAC